MSARGHGVEQRLQGLELLLTFGARRVRMPAARSNGGDGRQRYAHARTASRCLSTASRSKSCLGRALRAPDEVRDVGDHERPRCRRRGTRWRTDACCASNCIDDECAAPQTTVARSATANAKPRLGRVRALKSMFGHAAIKRRATEAECRRGRARCCPHVGRARARWHCARAHRAAASLRSAVACVIATAAVTAATSFSFLHGLSTKSTAPCFSDIHGQRDAAVRRHQHDRERRIERAAPAPVRSSPPRHCARPTRSSCPATPHRTSSPRGAPPAAIGRFEQLHVAPRARPARCAPSAARPRRLPR